jgi:hypothetical protein
MPWGSAQCRMQMVLANQVIFKTLGLYYPYFWQFIYGRNLLAE